MPALARCAAMRAPIVPAPSTAAFSIGRLIESRILCTCGTWLQKRQRGSTGNARRTSKFAKVLCRRWGIRWERRQNGYIKRSAACDRSPTQARASVPRWACALGGGFARGIAHIGVLRVLEENEIPIDFIAGTSVGALIAATYASGTPLDEMERQGSRDPLSRFRPLDAFAHGHGLERASRAFPAQIHAGRILQPDENSAEHRRHRLDHREVRSLHRRRNRPGSARVVRLSRAFSAGGISRAAFSWTDSSPRRSPRKRRAIWARTS